MRILKAARIWLWCLAVGASVGASVGAAAEVAIPSLTARVTDVTGTLTAGQKAGLEKSLADFEARKGSQIAVLIVPATAPQFKQGDSYGGISGRA